MRDGGLAWMDELGEAGRRSPVLAMTETPQSRATENWQGPAADTPNQSAWIAFKRHQGFKPDVWPDTDAFFNDFGPYQAIQAQKTRTPRASPGFLKGRHATVGVRALERYIRHPSKG